MGFVNIQIAGTKINAEIRHKNIETMIRNAKDRIKGKADKNNTEKPTITEKALIIIPLPVVFKLMLIASGYDLPLVNSVFNRQKI